MEIDDFLTWKFGAILIVSIFIIVIMGVPGLMGIGAAWLIGSFGSKFYSQMEMRQRKKRILKNMLKQKNDKGQTLTYILDGKPWVLNEHIKNNSIPKDPKRKFLSFSKPKILKKILNK